jgi:hypothetical protein
MHNKISYNMLQTSLKYKYIPFFIFEKNWYNGGYSFLEGLYMYITYILINWRALLRPFKWPNRLSEPKSTAYVT